MYMMALRSFMREKKNVCVYVRVYDERDINFK